MSAQVHRRPAMVGFGVLSSPPTRRSLLVRGLVGAGCLTMQPHSVFANLPLMVHNVTQLYPVRVARIETPSTVGSVVRILKSWPGQVSVGGGRYSMGGQVAVAGGLHLDLRGLNRLVWIRPHERTVRVEAGMRWRDLQDHLDPLGLAVKTKQSYANFTIGGSVSVNCHGRYVGHGPVGHTVRALQLVTADGAVLEVSAQSHPALFAAAIGGYGAVGVITEVELDLVENVRISRTVQAVPLVEYAAHFRQSVLEDAHAVLHNADLLPPSFDEPVCVTWRKVSDAHPLTESQRLVPHGQHHPWAQNAIWALTELPGGGVVNRKVVHPWLHQGPAVKWLNHEASLDVGSLEPRTRAMSTYVLQEYFVPEARFIDFVTGMALILREHGADVLNISIRHSPADRVSLLPWAPQPVFCFVLYFKQRTWPSAQDAVGQWTRLLIDWVLHCGGRYYLPYQLHASLSQFNRAYPEADRLRTLKRRVDPGVKFSNELWRKYL